MKRTRKENLISWVDIFVTERCNLSCVYCFHKQTPRDMSDETMQKSIELLRDRITDDCIFNFFGGEPLLRQDFCIKWYQELRREFPKCRFAISTNAVEYPDIMESHLNSELFDVQISYDGVYQEQNRGRSVEVRKNIERYMRSFDRGNVHVRMTFTKDTVGSIVDSVRDIYGLGGRRVSHQADMTNDWTQEHFDIYKEQLVKLYALKKGLKDLKLYFLQCDRVTNEKTSICAMGKGLIAIDAAGEIYPCHRAIKFSEFKIGDVHSGVLNRGMFMDLVIDECDGCPVSATCHPCVIANYELSGSLMKNPVSTCAINKLEYEMSMAEYREVNEDLFENEKILTSMIPVLEDLKTSGAYMLKAISEELNGRY